MSAGGNPAAPKWSWTIAQRLSLIVIVVAVPLLLLSAAAAWWLVEDQRDASRASLMYSARSIMGAVDAELGKYMAVARTLASSPSLQAQDIAAFREEAERALPAVSGGWVLLADVDGRQIMNTAAPAGAQLPRLHPQVDADKARAFETKEPHVTDVRRGPVTQRLVVGVGVPIFRNNEPAYYLQIAFEPTLFLNLLNRERLPEGWLAGIADKNANFVARSRDHERLAGEPTSAGFRAVRDKNGIFEFASVDERMVVHANAVSEFSGWTMATAVEKSVLDAPLRRTALFGTIAALAMTLASLLFATWAARRITSPLEALKAGAEALRLHRPVVLTPTRIPEINEALDAFATAGGELTAQARELKQNEARFRLLVKGVKDYAIYMIDPAGRVSSWNEGARRLKGWDEADIIGRHISVFYPAETAASSELQLALNAGAYEKECEHVRKDGTRFWAATVTTPIHDDAGQLKGFSRITCDLSERKRTEEQLRQQVALLDLALDAIFVCGGEGEIVFWNKGAERTYGWTAEEAKGRVARHLLKTKYPQVPAEIVAQVEQSGQWEGELLHAHKDGRELVVHSRWAMQRDRSGQPIGGILEITRDITDRKQAERELAIATGRLHATVATALDAIIVIDAQGVVQSANPALERIFGYRPDELVGENVSLLMPEPHRAHQRYIANYLETGVAKIIGKGREVEAQRKDGTIIPCDLAIAEWYMNGQRYFTGILRDITERRRAAENTQLMMRELAHRTKNLLAVVQAIAGQTTRTSVDLEDFRERFASRLQALSRSHDLLAQRDWHGVHLDELVRGQLELFGAERQLVARGPDIVLKPATTQSLGIALHELATNASKHGALRGNRGRIEVDWRIEVEGASPGRLRMTWCERGGPAAEAPDRWGFGCSIIKEMTEHALNGEVVLEFAPEGLCWHLSAPVEQCLVE